MAKFNFNSNFIELDIENHHFQIDAMEVQAKAPIIREKMNEIVKIAGAESFDGDIIEQSCRTVCACIDDMLGSGAGAKVFAGRTVNFFDCMDLYFFVQNEVNSFTAKKLAEYETFGKGKTQKGKK